VSSEGRSAGVGVRGAWPGCMAVEGGCEGKGEDAVSLGARSRLCGRLSYLSRRQRYPC
jgi:hypothetical protein